MELDKQAITVLGKLKDKAPDPGLMRDSSAIYWDALSAGIGNCIRNKSDISLFLKNEQDFINIGLTPHVIEKPNDIKRTMGNTGGSKTFIAILYFTDWLSRLCAKIVQGDKKELLEKEVASSRLQIKHLEKEIIELQQQRQQSVTAEPIKSLTTRPHADLQTGLNTMTQLDAMLRIHSKFKKAVSKGTFFSVADKRKHCDRENTLATMKATIDGFLESYQPNFRAAVKALSTQVATHFSSIIDVEDSIEKMQKDIEELAKKKDTISPIETEARIVKEIDYLKDLLKLAAKRLHTEHSPFIKPDDKFFTVKELVACIDRIMEFDPKIFHNERVPIFGRPDVLLIPGTGNAMYDWKNNIFIVPTLPPSGNFMASIAFGMLEYRLDTDEDKKLLTSYNQLPQYETVKSIFQLRADLAKDYITWMVSEYKGYKTLAKEIRKWFEHEIAPTKNDIYLPPQFEPFVLSTEEFNKLLETTENNLSQQDIAQTETDLFTAAILNYQQGKFDRSAQHLKVLVAKNPAHDKAWYNLGHIYTKLMQKQDAIKCFIEFTKVNPQSWWSSVAQEQVRRLQVG